MKLNLGQIGNNEIIDVDTQFISTRNGFNHIASTTMPDYSHISAKCHYINRTWEVYPYQSVLHFLCDKIAMTIFGAPSSTFYTAKKWATARDYAKELSFQCDKVRGY